LVIDARHWIAGHLPRGVGSVILASKEGRPYDAATVDDNCYYFEFVGKGDYLLRFQVSPGHLVDIPGSFEDFSESGRVVNLSDQDMIRAFNEKHTQPSSLIVPSPP
jgi:hypothetical protein